MKISVALAYYNGGQFIKEQLESILSQLGDDDEVILSVDKAEDGSEKLLVDWAGQDGRIQILRGPARGVVKNFEHAMAHCNGDVIFLSDQDDVWKPEKVRKVMKAFEKNDCMAVLHNGIIVDQDGKETGVETLFEMRGSQTGFLKNFIKNSYIGCCMAFRKELLPIILPIPEKMFMHDYWIGMAAEYSGRVGLIREPLICYRRHEDNVTEMHHGDAIFMIRKRINMIRCFWILKKRVKKGVSE